MKRITLSAFIVLALISIDASISMAYAKTKITIFKVTKVSSHSKLQLRAWPSPKSRVKVSLPYNAVDLVETGKQKSLNNSKWIEVNWKNNKGWVNTRYLKKTGVLLRPNTQANTQIASTNSRNIKSVVKSNTTALPKTKIVSNKVRVINKKARNITPPIMEDGNRYSQPTQIAAREVKTGYSAKKQSSSEKMLNCVGSSPQTWSIKMNVSAKKMKVSLKNGRSFDVPINYHEWASPSKVRMNIGGNKGRNIVDVNLEKTDACSTGLSRKNYLYEVNASINRQNFSGCCDTVSQ